jgi:hypothetical protein
VEECLLDDGVCDGVDIVVQTDPLGEADPVPFEERDPRAVERGEKDEEPIQRERGKDVQEANESRLARAPAGASSLTQPASERQSLTGQDGPCSSPSERRP